MVVAEIDKIKIELINWIKSIKDPGLIQIIEALRLSEHSGDWWNDLTNAEQEEIENGMKQLDESKGMSSEEFWRKFKSG